jgi:hypothetical protein
MSKEHPIEVRDMAIVYRLFRQAYEVPSFTEA